MGSFLNRLFGWITGPRPKLRCDPRLWDEGVAELERRTRGHTRESGAYLLGEQLAGGGRRITEFVFYDDVDPYALDTGIVTIRETALPRLWEICRDRKLGVVADIHVHPFGSQQSDSDQANPVMPRAGHLAIILPDYAAGETRPGGIGLYEFLGHGQWRDHSRPGSKFLLLQEARK